MLRHLTRHAVGHAPSCGAARPALAAAASATPAAPPGARGYITAEALAQVRRVRIGEAAVQAYSLQRPHRCWDNSAAIHGRIVDRLVSEQVLSEDPVRSWKRRFDLDQGLVKVDAARTRKNPGGALTLDIVKDCLDRLGVVHLTHYNALQPGQGDDVYTDFHSCVLLGIFQDQDGRPVGLLVDGNDRQDNPAMRDLKRLMQEIADRRPLSQLAAGDLAHYTRLAQERLGSGEDLRQMVFRFVRMDDWLAAGNGAQAMVIAVDPAAMRRPTAPAAVSAQEAQRMQRLLRDDPSLIEPSPPPKPPPGPLGPPQVPASLLHFPIEALAIP